MTDKEEAEVLEWLTLEYQMETDGFLLPAPLCSTCAGQLFAYFHGLEDLQDLMDAEPHVCLHTLTPVTVLNAVVCAPGSDLVDQLTHDIGHLGWNFMPDLGRPGRDIWPS